MNRILFETNIFLSYSKRIAVRANVYKRIIFQCSNLMYECNIKQTENIDAIMTK